MRSLEERNYDLTINKVSCLVLLILCFNISLCAAQDIDHILEGIKARHAHLSGISVGYTREVITRTMSMLGNQVKGDLAKGTIYLKPPYFLKLEQIEPREEFIYTDGETLWWYVPLEKVAHRYNVEEFGKELRLLSSISTGGEGPFCRRLSIALPINGSIFWSAVAR